MAGRFDEAIARIDAVHAEDPQKEDGQAKELLYAQRMSAWLCAAGRFRAQVSRTARSAICAGARRNRWRTPSSRASFFRKRATTQARSRASSPW